MPAIDEVDKFYLEAFWDLSTCRQFGFVAGPIPYDKIKEDTADRELDEESARIFIRVIRELDKVFLEWCEQERETKKKNQ